MNTLFIRRWSISPVVRILSAVRFSFLSAKCVHKELSGRGHNDVRIDDNALTDLQATIMEDSAEPVVEVLEDTVLLEEIFPGDATAFGNLNTLLQGAPSSRLKSQAQDEVK